MGKPKQQRTKGNLQPASSSRAAELSSFGSSNPLSFQNLGGFAQFAGSLPVGSPILEASETAAPLAADLEPGLLVIVKKISKRDAITKLKALEELQDYLKQHPNSLATLVPTWTRMYVKLTIEVDRRVRLATNNVHQMITVNAKKKLAPYLKEIIGAWIITTLDPSKDVARAAIDAFESCFAEDKRQGVLEFCQRNILEYVTEMLLEKTPETLSDPRHVSKEDMAAKFARVVSSAFQCIALLLDKISLSECEKCLDQYEALFDSATLWKYMGHGNAMIRKSIYMLLKSLWLQWKDILVPRLPTITPQFISSAFSEKEPSAFSELWDAWLLLSKGYPEMWNIASKKKSVLSKLYNFLRGALNGAVTIGYPSIIVLLAYLPEELRSTKSFYKEFFSNFWEGLSSEYIDRANAHIFFNSYAECLVFAATRQSHEEKAYLIEEVFYILVQSFLSGGKERKLEPGHAGILAKYFISLASNNAVRDYLPGLNSKLENLLVMTVTDCVLPDKRAVSMDIFCEATGCFLAECASSESSAMSDIVNDWSKRVLFSALTSVLVHKDHAFSLLFLAVKLSSKFWSSFSQQDQEQLAKQGKLLLPYLTAIGVQEESIRIFVDFYMILVEWSADRKALWTSAMEQVRALGDSTHKSFALTLFLEKLEHLPIQADVGQGVLDDTCQAYCKAVANESEQNRPLIEQVNALTLISHLSRGTLTDKIFSDALDAYKANISALVRLRYISKDSQGSLLDHIIQPALSSLRILQNVLVQKNGVRTVFSLPGQQDLAAVLFDANFVKRPSEDDDEQRHWSAISEISSAIWETFTEQLPKLDCRQELANLVVKHVKNTITDVSYISSPAENAKRAEKCISTFYPEESIEKMISDFVGNEGDWKKLQLPFLQKTTNYLMLTILDPFASFMTAPLVDEDELMPIQYDIDGLSAYGRLLFFAAELLGRAKAIKEHSEWIALQLLVAGIECRQGVELAGVSRLWSYQIATSWSFVHDFIQCTDSIYAQCVQSIVEKISAKDLVSIFTSSGKESPSLLLGKLVQSLATSDEINSTSVAAAHLLSKILKDILEHLAPAPSDLSELLGLLKAEARELNLAGKVAVQNAVKDLVGQEPQYRNLQSDLASKLSGVSSIQEFDDEQGFAWNLLVLLNASSLEFGSLCIPSQRLLYLLRTLRSWYNEDAAAEQDLPMHQRTLFVVQLDKLFGHLAQSLQDVSAGQWDFFLNKSYEWIAYADVTIEEELPVVYHALTLFNTLRDLSQDGPEDLREVFQARVNDFYKVLLELFAKVPSSATGRSVKSAPLARFQELVADSLEYVPENVLLEASSVPDICALLKEKNQVLQKRAYKILQKHVSYTVQDTAVRLELSGTSDEENANRVQIEDTLFNLLISTPDISFWHAAPFEEQALHQVFGYMLSWLLLFEHFQDITFRLKQEYTQQLKDADALVDFMPFLSKILGVGAGQSIETFDLTPWDVACYDIEGFESSVETSYLLLAAHLYYRALKHIPSLVRQWWLDCKNRQLTIGIESFTEKNFSTNLINDELDLLSREDIKSTLEDNENDFSIKALRAASEVSATYRVDEQNMQIAIKYPKNFPLRQIDVEGVQKVGVSDRQWRGWMFSVAAVIGAQNGNIVDALTVFKRNVNLHFEGVEDCTICYSIISAQDRSIPGKQCRTCKNKFHSSCLYKWFRSSNSASCPLCRTVF